MPRLWGRGWCWQRCAVCSASRDRWAGDTSGRRSVRWVRRRVPQCLGGHSRREAMDLYIPARAYLGEVEIAGWRDSSGWHWRSPVVDARWWCWWLYKWKQFPTLSAWRGCNWTILYSRRIPCGKHRRRQWAVNLRCLVGCSRNGWFWPDNRRLLSPCPGR